MANYGIVAPSNHYYIPPDVFGREKGLHVVGRRYSENGDVKRILWCQNPLYRQHGRIPTNFEWSRILQYSHSDIPQLVDMFLGEVELTDTLIDFTGVYPVAVTGANVIDDNGIIRIHGGQRKMLRWLPTREGYIQEWSEEEELPTLVGSKPNDKFYDARFQVRPSRLKVVTRGGMRRSNSLEKMFDVNISIAPFYGSPLLSFHFVRDM